MFGANQELRVPADVKHLSVFIHCARLRPSDGVYKVNKDGGSGFNLDNNGRVRGDSRRLDPVFRLTTLWGGVSGCNRTPGFHLWLTLKIDMRVDLKASGVRGRRHRSFIVDSCLLRLLRNTGTLS